LSQHNLPPSLLLLLVCSTNSVTDFDDEALLTKKQLLLPMMMLSTAALHCTLFRIRRHGTTQMLHNGLGHRGEVPVLTCAEWSADESVEVDAAVRETQQPTRRRMG
jgi:hypothetical protein